MPADQGAAEADPARDEASPDPAAADEMAQALHAAHAADQAGVGARVMAVMAILAADGVRRDLLHAAGQAGLLDPTGRQVTAGAVDEVLTGLARQSLLTLSSDGQTAAMDPVAATMTRSQLARHGQLATTAQAAVTALEAWTRTLGVAQDRAVARDLPGQVTALADSVTAPAGQAGEKLSLGLLRLRFLALYCLIELGESAPRAVAVGEPLAADLERVLGADHPDTLNARNSLAAAYLAAGRPAEAIPIFRRTLLRRERIQGADHPDTLVSQNNLAAAYQDAGRAAEAISLFRLTLAARERRLGADDPDTLNSRSNLAAAYRAAGRAAEAVPLLEQTLAGRERVFGPGHPDTQAARGNLERARRETTQSAAQSPPAPPEPGSPVTGERQAREPEDETSRDPVPAPAPEPGIPRPQPSAGPGRSALRGPRRAGVRLPWVAAAVLALITASGVAFAVAQLHPGGGSTGPAKAVRSQPADAAQMAADWVARQVNHSVTVACDPLMCAALEARGVPTGRLLVLRTSTASPRGAGVVVATPAVRSQFGSRLDSEYAPSVIAGFGSGPGQVNVQVVASAGAVAYRAVLRQDLAARKAAGQQLLANKQIEVTPEARKQLAAGAVDSRLLILLPALAATHPVQVLAFGDSGPRASPDSPLCAADLSGSGRAAGMTDVGYQGWLTSFVRAQPARFTGSVATVQLDGRAVVRVQFSTPSPLGLLTDG